MKRVQKIISECGITSRRKAEELIEKGKVKVNDKVITIGDKADITTDKIVVEGKLLKPQKRVYLALNKPKGLVTSTKDPHEKTIMDLVPQKYRKLNVFPVGRLDKHTEGLLFLTNDGDFANQIMHPSNKTEKKYEGIVAGNLSKENVDKIRSGIVMEEGIARCKIFTKPMEGNTFFIITIKTGWNRQVRRMFEAVGHKVINLKRTAVGNFTLDHLGKKRIQELSSYEMKKI